MQCLVTNVIIKFQQIKACAVGGTKWDINKPFCSAERWVNEIVVSYDMRKKGLRKCQKQVSIAKKFPTILKYGSVPA